MFSEQERKIFQYTDDQGEAFADPMAAQRALNRARTDQDIGQLFKTIQDAGLPDELVDDAWTRLVAIAFGTFSFAPLDPRTGKGMVEDDAVKVLADFLVWSAKKNESTANSLTSSAPTEPASSPSPAAA